MTVRPIVWMRAVRDAVPRFTSARQQVLWALGLRMDANGTGFASMSRLADDASVDPRTARRATTDARGRGYLVQTRRGHRIDGATVVASEWALAVPSQPDTGAGLSQTQGDTGVLLGADPRGQKTKPKGTEMPTQGDTRVPPRGLHQEVSHHQSPRARTRAESLIADTGATDDEIEIILKKINGNGAVRNAGAYVAALTRNGDLAAMLAEIRQPPPVTLAEQIAELRRKPPCDHGEDGGDQLHPTGGEPLCLECRLAHRRSK